MTIFSVLVALCISGLGKCLFRSFAHFLIGLLDFFGCWFVSVDELVILKPQPGLGFGNQIECLQVVHGRLYNGDFW